MPTVRTLVNLHMMGSYIIGTNPLTVNVSSGDGFQGETVCIDLNSRGF